MTTDSKHAHLFEELVKAYKFSIPPYQRAYAWKKQQIEQLLKDLAEHAAMGSNAKDKNYYLGHFILEKDEEDTNSKRMEIVDGQQRLTSIALVYSACKARNAEATNAYPAIDLKVQEYDNDFFQAVLNNGKAPQAKTSSQKRMAEVFDDINTHIDNELKKKNLNVTDYLSALYNAYVSFAVYNNKSVAAQIFELHNTRGVPLSETEKVKAALMKYVYNFSADSEKDISEIQDSFAKVFELEEKSREVSFRGQMNLDHILMHHLRAMDAKNLNNPTAQDYSTPGSATGQDGCFAYVKDRLTSFQADPAKGVSYAKTLAKEFAISMALVCDTFTAADKKNPLVGDVILLDQHHSMVFLLRYFRALPNGADSGEFELLLKRWEAFLLLWNWNNVFFNIRGEKDRFYSFYNLLTKSEPEKVNKQVSEMLWEYYAGKKPFADKRSYKGNLGEEFKNYLKGDGQRIFPFAYQHSRYWFMGNIRYVLYKYEIFLAGEVARKRLRELFKKDDLSLEHIVAREISWKDRGRSEPTDDDKKWWNTHMAPIIDNVGNLLLLSRAENAAAGNDSLKKKQQIYVDNSLTFGSYQLKEWTKNNEIIDSKEWPRIIKQREENILKFVTEYFTAEEIWPKTNS